MPVTAAPARCLPRRSRRRAPCPQIHRPSRDRQRLSRLQRPACGGRQLFAAHPACSATFHHRASFPVSLRGFATSATAPTRSPHSVVLLDREATCCCGDATQSRKRSEEHPSELQSLTNIVCGLLLEQKAKEKNAAGGSGPSSPLSRRSR